MTASAPCPRRCSRAARTSSRSGCRASDLPGRLRSTVHLVTVGPRVDLAALMLRGYLPGFAAGGALLLGACTSRPFLSDRRDRAAGFLALLAWRPLGQLAAEGWRGLVNYTYPLHVFRLWAILGTACVYALALVAYVTERCRPAVAAAPRSRRQRSPPSS